MEVIAICGGKGSGKNYVADTIRDVVNAFTFGKDEVVVSSFADPLKKFVVEELGLEPRMVYGNDDDKNKVTKYRWSQMPQHVREKNQDKFGQMTAREVMQVFGTEMTRDVWGMDIWVNSLCRKAESFRKQGCAYFVVPDLRFPNEAEAVRKMGGIIWKVVGDRAPAAKDGHRSETLVGEIGCDIVVTNNKSDDRDAIFNKVATFLGYVEAGHGI